MGLFGLLLLGFLLDPFGVMVAIVFFGVLLPD